jgi:hypothetical protein
VGVLDPCGGSWVPGVWRELGVGEGVRRVRRGRGRWGAAESHSKEEEHDAHARAELPDRHRRRSEGWVLEAIWLVARSCRRHASDFTRINRRIWRSAVG